MVLSSSCAEKHDAAPDNAVDVNDSSPALILARLCSYVPDDELCTVPVQQAAFNQLISTYREFVSAPLFNTTKDFLDFVEGRGDAYAAIREMLGADNPLLSWTPVTISDELRSDVASAFNP
jgi:hypothetical protein